MPTRLVLFLLLLLLTVRTAPAAVYVLTPPPPFEDIVGNPVPFGYSGTITTDGSTGQFNSAAPIVDWEITYNTPGFNDGVTAQVMTPMNSSLTYLTAPSSMLVITSQAISITPSTEDNIEGGLEFSITPNDEFLSFKSSRPNLEKGVGAFDLSESAFGGFVFLGFGDFEIATLAPVPGDTDGDGDVDIVDLDTLGANFGVTGQPDGASIGDFDEDGDVDLVDLDTLGANFTAGISLATPEPTALALLVVAGLIHPSRWR